MSETLVLPYEVPVSGITPTAKGIEGGGAACYDSDVLELPNSPLAAAKDQEETNEAGAVRIKTGQPACDGADVLSHSSEALRAASVLAVLAGNLRDNTEDKRVGHQSPGVVDKPGASTTYKQSRESLDDLSQENLPQRNVTPPLSGIQHSPTPTTTIVPIKYTQSGAPAQPGVVPLYRPRGPVRPPVAAQHMEHRQQPGIWSMSSMFKLFIGVCIFCFVAYVDLLVVFASTKRMSTDNIHQIMSQHSGIAGTGIAIL